MDAAKIEIAGELPETIEGFTVKAWIGPYPMDAPGSHRRAIYVELRPTTEDLIRKLEWIGRTHILSHGELEREAAEDLAAGRLLDTERETLIRQVVRPAAALARQVATS